MGNDVVTRAARKPNAAHICTTVLNSLRALDRSSTKMRALERAIVPGVACLGARRQWHMIFAAHDDNLSWTNPIAIPTVLSYTHAECMEELRATWRYMQEKHPGFRVGDVIGSEKGPSVACALVPLMRRAQLRSAADLAVTHDVQRSGHTLRAAPLLPHTVRDKHYFDVDFYLSNAKTQEQLHDTKAVACAHIDRMLQK